MKELLGELEEKRKIALKQSRYESLFCIIILFAMTGLLVAGLINKPFPVIWLIVIELLLFGALVFIGTIFNKKNILFCYEYKNVIVKDFLNTFLNDLTFTPDEGITEDVIKSTQMITIDDLTSKNLIKAKYNDIDFSCSDVKIGRSGDESGVTTYEAIWFSFDIKTNLPTDVILQSKKFKLSKGPNLFNKWHRIKYANAPFNDRFKVYSDDKDYGLSTNIIDAVMKLPFDNFAVLFHDMNIHIIICDTTLNFEPKLTYPVQTQIDEMDIQLSHFKKIIISCCNFVHMLDVKH